MENKLNSIHFTIDTTKYPAWKDKDEMIRHAMGTIEEIKKKNNGNCDFEIIIVY